MANGGGYWVKQESKGTLVSSDSSKSERRESGFVEANSAFK